MRQSHVVRREATFIEKLAASLAMLAIVTLSVPPQAYAVGENPSVNSDQQGQEQKVDKIKEDKIKDDTSDQTVTPPNSEDETISDTDDEGELEEDVVESAAQSRAAPPEDPSGKCEVTGNTTTKTFSLATAPQNGQLSVKTSGDITVTLNGVEIKGNDKNYSIKGSELQAGTNTLVFTPSTATLTYNLSVHGSECGETTPPPPPPAPQSCKLVSDDQNTYIGSSKATHTYTHPAWSTELNGDGAQWIWNKFEVTDPTQPETVSFTRTFNVSASPTAATLKIAADNSYTVSVNGTPITACDGSGDSNFAAVESCTIPVVSGSNTITFTATNAATPGNADPRSNPAGLYYEVNVTGASCTEVPPAPKATVTLCKVSDAQGKPGLSGWQLFLKGSNVQTGLSVPSTNSAGVSSNALASGVQYLVTSMGTWANQGGANLVDAEYSTTDSWATHFDGYPGFQNDILELQINSAFDPNSNWGPYSSSHTYSRLFTAGTNGPANFRIFDGTGTTQNDGTNQTPNWFGDNSGTLSVNIDQAYGGTTGETGCVTLTDVPYGTYTAGEIAQEGWTLTKVEGAQGSSVTGTSVVVDSPTESVTFINHKDLAPEQSCVIGSDTTTLEGGEPSYIATFIHSSWTALIDGVSWVWGDPAIVDPVGETTQTFTKTFTLSNVPVAGGTLQIAADNSYEVKVNGVAVGADASEDNYTSAGQDLITVPAANLVAGVNTLEIKVKNFAMAGGTQETNPAGLKYKLTIAGATCTQAAPTYKVHIFKYLDEGETVTQVPNDSSAPLFPMKATYTIAGIGTNQDPAGDDYQLGNGGGVGGSDNGLKWAANTLPLHAGDAYGTYEVTGGNSPVVANAGLCSADKYYLEGYKVGDSLAAAQSAAISPTVPSFPSITKSQYVIVVNKKCGDTTPPTPTTLKVHIYKYLQTGSGEATVNTQVPNDATSVPLFPMVSTWKASNLNEGATSTGSYVLGNNEGGTALKYAADTSPMNAPASYETHEITTGDSPVVASQQQCSPGKYYLVGYKNGSSLAAAQSATPTATAPQYYGLTSDQYQIVVNRACPSGNPGGGDTTSANTTVITGNTSAGDNQLGWFFNRDPRTAAPFAFATGNASIGSGSLSIAPIANNYSTSTFGTCSSASDQAGCNKFVGELFLQTPLPGLKSISYDFNIASPNLPTTANQFYLNVYANFGESSPTKFYDCRYDVVPTVGVVNGYTTVTFDPTLSYPVTTRGGVTTASPHPCPASPAGMDALDGAGTPSIRAIAINVGDTSSSDTGVSGYLDKVVTVIKTGLNTHTQTYDFEAAPTEVVTPTETITPTDTTGNNNRRGRSGGRSGGGNGGSNGSVLGASTSADAVGQVLGASCSLLLPNYLKMGWANNLMEVKDLQTFLNADLATSLPVTGFFGMLTENAVKAFQSKYGSDVLTPWVGLPASGITNSSDATGFVYKTTQWKINMIHCPELNLPLPTLD